MGTTASSDKVFLQMHYTILRSIQRHAHWKTTFLSLSLSTMAEFQYILFWFLIRMNFTNTHIVTIDTSIRHPYVSLKGKTSWKEKAWVIKCLYRRLVSIQGGCSLKFCTCRILSLLCCVTDWFFCSFLSLAISDSCNEGGMYHKEIPFLDRKLAQNRNGVW
jgi:hypothetical protein